MTIRYFALLVSCFCFMSIATAQPQGLVNPNSDDTIFEAESAFVTHPNQIIVNMELRNNAEIEEDVVSSHLSARAQIFDALDVIGITYQGQAEDEFSKRTTTSFVRRTESFQIWSEISATLKTDEHLVMLATLIDQTDSLDVQEFTVEYSEEDSIEEIQKNVINKIIADAHEDQKEMSNPLTPRGISKMDVVSEAFGEETVEELLGDNRIPEGLSISNTSLELIGIEHQVSAGLIFH